MGLRVLSNSQIDGGPVGSKPIENWKQHREKRRNKGRRRRRREEWKRRRCG